MKRYVMLEDKEIVDTRNNPIYHIAEDTLWHNSMLQGTIIKQSDNLLDLLEVGDCVEFENKKKEAFIYHIPDKEAFNLVIDDISNSTKEDNAYVVAIWKRNGDVMRRYEV